MPILFYHYITNPCECKDDLWDLFMKTDSYSSAEDDWATFCMGGEL